MTLSRRELLQASLIAGLWRPAELAAQSLVTADVIAETTMGRIRGVAIDGVNVFKGVPYAGNVDGPGRFLPPPPVERWNGAPRLYENWCTSHSGSRRAVHESADR